MAEPLPGMPRPDPRGLTMCKWGCGQIVRRTTNARRNEVLVNPVPDERGIIAAYWDGARWRSRQLQKGEGLAPHETRWLIHLATCWRYARLSGRPARPPRPVPERPPPGPAPSGLVDATHERLAAIRERRREKP